MLRTIEQIILPDGNKWDYTYDGQNQVTNGILTDPKGRKISDYSATSPDEKECCNPAIANVKIAECMAEIDKQTSKYVSDWIGVSVGVDALRILISGGAAWALIKTGGKAAISIGTVVLAVEGVIDLGVISLKMMQIYDAAKEAKEKFCACPKQKK